MKLGQSIENTKKVENFGGGNNFTTSTFGGMIF